MALPIIHLGLARACVLFSLIMGLYGLWLFARKEGVGGNLLGIMAVGELLYIAQVIVGGWMYLEGLRPARPVHYLHGVVLIIRPPGAYACLRGKEDRREALIYGLIGLFLAGVSLRATFTAGF